MNKFNGLGLGLSDSLVAAATKIVIEGKEYKDFFNAALKKFGVTSPAELKGDKEKEFYDYIDKNWKGKDEKSEEIEQVKPFAETEVDEGLYASKKVDRNKATTKLGKWSRPTPGISARQAAGMRNRGEEVVAEDVVKSKLKVNSKVFTALAKLEKSEKGMNDKEVAALSAQIKKGIEVESHDGEPAIITDKALKSWDIVWGKMDTLPRDDVYTLLGKHDEDAQYSILAPYGA